MSEMHVLLVHGMTGAGPWHWQQWLAGRLREQDVPVELPALPNPDQPDLDRWLPLLRERLAAVPPEAELVVAAHACGSVLWLHHAATMEDGLRRADRDTAAKRRDLVVRANGQGASGSRAVDAGRAVESSHGSSQVSRGVARDARRARPHAPPDPYWQAPLSLQTAPHGQPVAPGSHDRVPAQLRQLSLAHVQLWPKRETFWLRA